MIEANVLDKGFVRLMKFLELRTSEHAMYEIRQYAILVEKMLTELFPVTMNRFIENGRIAP